MFLRAVIPACCLSIAAHAGTQVTKAKVSVTPIQEVLTLMEQLKTKNIKAKDDEETAFHSFAEWCDVTAGVKIGEIKTDKETIGMDTAEIQQDSVQIKHDISRVRELEEDVARWKTDKKSATEVRDRERADFTTTVNDYSESIDAVSQAIIVLKKQTHDRTQAGLLQIQKVPLKRVHDLKRLPAASKKALAAFLQQEPYSGYSAPEANAYEFQSGGVVEMLEQLQDKFNGQKTDLEKEEVGAQHEFDNIMQQLSDSIEKAESEIGRKSKHKAQSSHHKAEVEGDLAKVTEELHHDEEDKSDLVALCKQKESDFNNRNKLRGEEIEAISKAIEIMGSQAVAGSGEKHLPALMQIRTKRGVSLASLRSDQKSPQLEKVAAFLSDHAKKSGSTLLSQIAEAAQVNPFGKVKKMIGALIVKLKEESESEASHHGWCQTELTTNKQTREARTSDISDLETDIESINADIAQLTQEMADLAAAVKELEAEMAKETQERNADKATNAETVKDAKAAQVAVEDAIAVLKDFYAKSAQATSFVQTKNKNLPDDVPETFDKAYKGALSTSGNIVDMLSVILSDFTRLESDTAMTEEEEQSNYETFMKETRKDADIKEALSEGKGRHKTDKEAALAQANADLKTTQEQLNGALNYYEKLKPTCVDSGITKEERDRRREEELVSLNEALKILQGTDLPTMR